MIRKRMGTLLTLSFLAAVSFLPMKAEATETDAATINIANDPGDGVYVLTDACGDNCEHTITGVSTSSGSSRANTVVVRSGTHTIYLQNVDIDAAATAGLCAFEIQRDATVNLVLRGTNNLASGEGRAGLSVSSGATVNISSSDGGTTASLTATAGAGGAGIGGESSTNVNAGTININSGSITATGSESGAGIGGTRDGSAGNITITGGRVTASGGMTSSTSNGGGAGIGSGGNSSSGGSVTISGNAEVTATGSSGAYAGAGIGSGGNVVIEALKDESSDQWITPAVTATGGSGTPNTETGAFQTNSGIHCSSLTSNGSEAGIITTYGNRVTTDNYSRFNAIIKNMEDLLDNTADYTVYGNIEVPDSFTLLDTGETLTFIDRNASMTLNQSMTNRGEITGEGTIINADILYTSSGSIADTVRRKVSLQYSDLHIEDLTYTGRNLTQSAVYIVSPRQTDNGPLEVDDSWTRKNIPEGGQITDESVNIIDAGTYTVYYIKNLNDLSEYISAEVTIHPRPLNDPGVSISYEPAYDYTGEEIKPELTITYNDMTLEEGEDYEVDYENNTEVGTATMRITGLNNYYSDGVVIEEEFEIRALSLNGG